MRARPVFLMIAAATVACGKARVTGQDKSAYKDANPPSADTTPPHLVSAVALAHTTIRVVFSEPLDAISAQDAENYHLQGASSPGVTAATQAEDEVSVTLTVQAGMQHRAVYTLLVQDVADTSGNAVGSASKELLGRGPVVAMLSEAPASFTRETEIRVLVRGAGITHYQCQLLSGAGAGPWSAERAISEPIVAGDLSDGVHELRVVGKDSLGNWQEFDQATLLHWTVDTTPPAALLSDLPGHPTNQTSAAITVSDNDVVAYRFSLDAAAWSSASLVAAPLTLVGLGEGEHTLEVIGRDQAGNWQDPSKATTYTWFVDRTSPIATLDHVPPSFTNSRTIRIVVAGVSVHAYRFALDGQAWSDESLIEAPIVAHDLAEGPHSLAVVGRDAAGNWQAPELATTTSWVVDVTAPTAILSNLPADPTSETTTAIAVGGEGVAEYRYRLDGGVWSGRIDAGISLTLKGLAEGSHLLEVVGIDTTTNEDLTSPATYAWSIDTSPPTAIVTVIGPPASPTNSQSLWIKVSGADVVAYKHAFSGGAWSAEALVSEPIVETGFVEGSHAVEIMGRDLAGNWQSVTSATSFAWDVDLTPPVAALSNLPANRTNVADTDIVVGGADVVAYRYRIDGGAWSAGTPRSDSIRESGLGEGEHTVAVLGRDAAGNWQPETDATLHTWTVDLTAPTAVLSNLPLDPTRQTTASIQVAGVDMVRYVYRLDSGPWSPEIDVGISLNLAGLSEATHTVDVRGRDAAGNLQGEGDATSYSWTVDVTPPVAELSGRPADPTASDVIHISVAGLQVAQYRYELDGGGWTDAVESSLPISAGGLSEASHTLSVIAGDAAGNWQPQSSATFHAWRVDQTPPIAPAVDDRADTIGNQGVFDDELLLTFRWSNPADIAEARIQVATDSGFSAIVYGGGAGAAVGTDESYDYIPDPSNGPRHYARVRVMDAVGNDSGWGPASDGIDLVGGLKGRVRDSSHNDLAGASVTLKKMSDDSVVGTEVSDCAGNFTFSNVPVGAVFYRIEVTKPGFVGGTKNNITVSVGSTTDIGIFHLVSEAARDGRISGRVVDANDGARIAGATISVRDWESTEVVVATSDSSGNFLTPLPALQPGTYSLQTTQPGYFALDVDNVIVDGDINAGDQALCEILVEPHVRVVLMWGASPRDLDLHVVGPAEQTEASDGDPTDRFHVYWAGQKSFNENNGTYFATADPQGSSATTSLVQDDTYRYGPEAINLFGVGSGYAYGTYTFSVHKWSWAGTWYDEPITLRIYDSQGLVQEIPIPSGAGSHRYWKAFKIEIEGPYRSERSVTIENTFGTLHYASKASMDW